MLRAPALASLTVLSALLPALSGCSTPGAEGSAAFRSVARGYQTALTGAQPLVARSSAEWAALWQRHTSAQLPRPPAPEVDFAKEMVVCVLCGERPSGGFGVEVEAARLEGGALVLSARESRPAPDAIVPMVVTRPYHMIATPQAGGPVRVEWR